MRVLWLAPYPHPRMSRGHPAPWITALARRLVDESDIRLTVVNVAHGVGDTIDSFEDAGIRFVYLPAQRASVDLAMLYQPRIRRLREYLASHSGEYDIIHIHGSEHQFEAAASHIPVPKLVAIQGIISEYAKVLPDKRTLQYVRWKLSGYYETRYLPLSDAFSVRTHWDRDFVLQLKPNAKLFQIWEMLRSEFFFDYSWNDKPNVLFVGGTNPIKGFREFVRAMDNVRQSHTIRAVVVGKCDLTQIQAVIDKYALKYVSLADFDVRGFLDAEGMKLAYADCFCLVHPSHIDNSPNSVCEAQVAGLPVIATQVGGVASLVRDRVTGRLITLEPASISRAIVEVYEDAALRDQMSSEAKRVARERHNPDTILADTLKAYRELVSNA